jgi:hypothetical protein
MAASTAMMLITTSSILEAALARLPDAWFSRNLPIDRRRVARYEEEVDLTGMHGCFLGLRLPRVPAVAYLSNTVIANHAHCEAAQT